MKKTEIVEIILWVIIALVALTSCSQLEKDCKTDKGTIQYETRVIQTVDSVANKYIVTDTVGDKYEMYKLPSGKKQLEIFSCTTNDRVEVKYK